MRDIDYYIYRLMFRLNMLIHLDLELNSYCNHFCKFCWHSKTSKLKIKSEKMPLEKVYDNLIEGRKHGLVSVKLNLRGEPTLYKDLHLVAKRAKELGYVDVMINTNGELLGDQWDKLRKYLTTVIISIGSTDIKKYADLHDVTAAQAQRVQTSLAYVHALKGRVNVKLNCHASKEDSIDYKYLKNRYPKFKIVKRHLMKREGEDFSIKRKKIRKQKCPHMNQRLTIQANGQIFPCCLSYASPKDILLGTTIPEALIKRKELMAEYSEGKFRQSCVDCSSQDVFKYEKV